MPRGILDLADELLSEILFFILQTDRTLYDRPSQNGIGDIDLRGNGSGAASDLDRWRLVCKQFMRIGTPRKFERFIVRCSGDGFRRLADLQKMQLACYVKSVTYLVRPFYQGKGATSYPCIYITKIPKTNVSDNNPGLTKDTTSTRKRKQTPLPPPHSPSARANHPSRNQPRPPTAPHSHDQLHIPPRNQAPPSTRRSGRTPHKIYRPPLAPKYTAPNPVYLGTRTHEPKHSPPSPKVPFIRFIGPQISAEACLHLPQTPATILAALGSRLTSLDITFCSNSAITTPIAALSSVLGRLLSESRRLISIHIGFPPKAPLDLDLDAVLHGITWKHPPDAKSAGLVPCSRRDHRADPSISTDAPRSTAQRGVSSSRGRTLARCFVCAA